MCVLSAKKAVEQELAHLARTHTVYQHTVAAAQRGDRVVLDFEGFMNGQSIPDSKMEHVSVVLGEGELLPAAEMAVCGHRAGEVFRFEFIYPANFRVPELSGKTAEFEINLRDVMVREVPALMMLLPSAWATSPSRPCGRMCGTKSEVPRREC